MVFLPFPPLAVCVFARAHAYVCVCVCVCVCVLMGGGLAKMIIIHDYVKRKSGWYLTRVAFSLWQPPPPPGRLSL